MNSSNKYLLYKFIFPNKKIYIGQTKQSFSRRLAQHKHNSINEKRIEYNFLINKAIRKYGWDNFTKEVILDKIAEDEIDNLERQYIKDCNTLTPNGYNLSLGGNKNKTHSEETKKKISNSEKGKIISLDSKKKMSLSKKGNKNPMYGKSNSLHPNSKKINQYDLNMNFIRDWECIKNAGENLNISCGNITNNCKLKVKSAGGFIWRYK